MEKEWAIEVRDVKKKFKVYFDKGNMLKEKVIHWKRNKYEERWVLNGINLKIKKGEAVGLIGQNGCGKSTTLKLLTRIMYPDAGEIIMNGRVSSLIELGAGFHPDLSGRENIYINASIFGLTKKEIDKRVNDIIAFSELEHFIDNPVRTYSSGMYMRLAFSVAINVDADILLIDEILAVGDANFQEKCFEKLIDIKSKGTTIVIVSHSLEQINQICERSIWLNDGKIEAEGPPIVVQRIYLDYMAEEKIKLNPKLAEEPRDTNHVIIKNVFLTNGIGETKDKFNTFSDICINIEYGVLEAVRKAAFSLCITRRDGLYCYGGTTLGSGMNYISLDKDGVAKVLLKEVSLLKGKYDISIGIEDDKKRSIQFIGQICSFEITDALGVEGAIYIDAKWELYR